MSLEKKYERGVIERLGQEINDVSKIRSVHV